MSADILRRAAALMRERAEGATGSPWVKRRGRTESVYGELGSTFVADTATREDMRHIASWHPAVALAVADWLDKEAELHIDFDRIMATVDELTVRLNYQRSTFPQALAVARAYLGET